MDLLSAGAAERRAKGKNLCAMVIFGTIGIFVRFIPLSSASIALARGLVGTAFLLLVSRLQKKHISVSDIRRNLPLLCISGIFLGANWILLFEAYRFTTVAVATLCYYLAPVFILIASPFVLGEKLTTARILCILGALLGMVLVSGVLNESPPGQSAVRGILSGVGAALLYASIVLLNKRIKSISAFDTTVMQLSVSALVLLPYVLLTGGASIGNISPAAMLLLLFVGVVHTGVAYLLYFGSIQHLRAQTAALFSYIDPVLAILLSALVLKERMDAFGVIGALLILGSTLLCELWEHRASPK